MRYGIGIDAGITSVGHSVVELDTEDNPRRIVRLGVRIFDAAENPKNGESLAKPRRDARGQRRRLRRHRHRLERIRGMIVSEHILDKAALLSLYDKPVSDIYELRVRALDELVSPEELARILIHMAQRRGFKSNRKAVDEKGGEDGVLLSAVTENERLCTAKGYRTVGEMLYKDEKFAQYKRNKGGDYQNTVSRDAVEKEVRTIFAAQRERGSVYATENVEQRYLDILLSQRSFADGPACGPYSGNQVERMRGRCTFLPDEPRIARAAYSFQVFSLWQKINHIRVFRNGAAGSLSDTERQEIFHLAHAKQTVTYQDLRKVLRMEESDYFTGLKYAKKDPAETEKKTKLNDLAIYHQIRSALKGLKENSIDTLPVDQLDAIGEALSKNQSDEAITADLTAAGVPPCVIERLLKLPNFSKYGHLCQKACRAIIPFLEEGMTYDKACTAAGFNFKADGQEPGLTLPPISADEDSITSPVVRRAVSQTIKVINAIIREMGESPVYLNIELAREMSQSRRDRDQTQKEQEKNAQENEAAMQALKEKLKELSGMAIPTGQDLVKYKLWKQQDGVCPYSGEVIEVSRLLEPGYVDVDHIVPYSKTFDDRMANKVLVKSRENREKANRLPLEYLTGEKRDRFFVWVSNQDSLPMAKKRRLLMESIGDEAEWKERNLVDTQFLSSFLSKYISTHLQFAPFFSERKRHVTCVNGAVTANVRRRWGLSKVRENGDLHHAMDATVIACVTQGMINRISRYAKYHECRYAEDTFYEVDPVTGEATPLFPHFPEPWEGFKNELEIRLTSDPVKMRQFLADTDPRNYEGVDWDSVKPVFVSRMCNHKVTGAAHKETFQSGRLKEKGQTLSKVKLNKLTLDKDGEIDGYYKRESDRLLYEALRERLRRYGGKGKEAFAEPFFKPRADGSDGPLVRSVKIVDAASVSVPVLGGTAVADNDSIVRVDVFLVPEDGYYFVPVYVADTVKFRLPQAAPTKRKDRVTGKRIWQQMQDEHFLFSLRKNDLLRVVFKGDTKLDAILPESTLEPTFTVLENDGAFLYFDGFDVSTASFSAFTHDHTYKKRGIGKTVPLLEKYEVDVLGNIRRVEHETRQTFH